MTVSVEDQEILMPFYDGRDKKLAETRNHEGGYTREYEKMVFERFLEQRGVE